LLREEQLRKEKSVSEVECLSLSSSLIISCQNSLSELSCCNNIPCFFYVNAIFLYSLCSVSGVISSQVVLYIMSDGGFVLGLCIL
jgi:hypothetical protein